MVSKPQKRLELGHFCNYPQVDTDNRWRIFRPAGLFRLNLRSGPALAAKNLFLRKQLSLYVERKKKPRRATDSARVTLAQLSRLFEWRDALTVIKPDTLISWHRKGFRWVWKGEVPIRRPSI